MSEAFANRPLSLAYYTVPELSPPETVMVAAEAGCQHVGVRLLGGQPGRDLPPIMVNPGLRRETLRRLRETGVTVLDANTVRLTPDTVIHDFQPFLEVAAEFGAKHVLASGDDPEIGRLREKLADLCDAAEEFALTVEIEFVPWTTISDLRAAASLVRRVGRRNMGVAVDALHFDRSGSRLEDFATLPREWFRYLHFCDAPRNWSADRAALFHTATKERLFPGEGDLDLVGLLCATPGGIPLALEIPTAELAETMPALERVCRAVTATRRVLAAAGA